MRTLAGGLRRANLVTGIFVENMTEVESEVGFVHVTVCGRI